MDVVTMPPTRKRKRELVAGKQTRSIADTLLLCGIVSSLLYVVMNILGAMRYEGYSSASQTVSELSAVGAPTRALWVVLAVVYVLLVTAFGWGVRMSARQDHRLRAAGGLLVAYGLTGLVWPLVPMHQRAVLAAGGGTLSDTMHIALSFVTVFLMLVTIGLGAAALGKRFRVYSVATLVALVAFGALTGLDGPRIAKDLPTPFIGVWERLDIAAFLLWIVVLAIALLRRRGAPDPAGSVSRITWGTEAPGDG